MPANAPQRPDHAGRQEGVHRTRTQSGRSRARLSPTHCSARLADPCPIPPVRTGPSTPPMTSRVHNDPSRVPAPLPDAAKGVSASGNAFLRRRADLETAQLSVLLVADGRIRGATGTARGSRSPSLRVREVDQRNRAVPDHARAVSGDTERSCRRRVHQRARSRRPVESRHPVHVHRRGHTRRFRRAGQDLWNDRRHHERALTCGRPTCRAAPPRQRSRRQRRASGRSTDASDVQRAKERLQRERREKEAAQTVPNQDGTRLA